MPVDTFDADSFNFSFDIFPDSSKREKITRVDKGSSIISLVRNYMAIDIETTGLDPYYDEIIEVAAARVIDGSVIDTFQSLIKPQNEIDSFITDLTGITNEMLASAPSMSEVLPLFYEFIGSSVLVGHNVNFDVNFLYDNFSSLKSHVLSNDYIDTMRFWRLLERDLPHHRLKDAVVYYNLGSTVEHRALSDAILAHRLYEVLLSHCIENNIDPKSLWKQKSNFKSSQIIASTSTFDESSPIFGKCFAFTGVMDKLTRKDAMQMVADAGGRNCDSVNKETNFLVVGNGGYYINLSDGKSSKHKKAEKMKLDGFDIEVISESVFLDLFE